MTEKHKIGPDGLMQDGVSSYPESLTDQVIYTQTQDLLSQLPTPVLYASSDAHQRVFIALFDGTGNDAIHDPEHQTNVGGFRKQLGALSFTDPHLAKAYVQGPGTQEHFITRTIDGMRGFTYDARLEEMYAKLIDQSAKWLQEDPQANIRIIETGFSRGADQAAGFSRMVHERGIQNPLGMVPSPNGGPPTFNGPPLIEPGKIPQAVALFDPVGTGVPQHHNRQLPPSVVSGFQIVARDERRNLFPSTQIIPQGLSSDGRFLGVTVPGAHSDIGGSYHLNGLGVLNGNLMTDYINRLSATPLLERQPEPTDPRMYVIHRSEEHLPIYRTSAYDHDGQRDVMGAQISPPHCRKVITCAAPEPVDEALRATLPMAFTPSREAPSPVLEASDTTSLYVSPTQDLSAYLDRMLVASQSGNDAEFRQMTQTLADLPPGRAMREEAIVTVDRQEQWQMDQQRAQTIEAPMMRMHH